MGFLLSRPILFLGHLFANILRLCLTISLLIGQFELPAATAVKIIARMGTKKKEADLKQRNTTG